MRRRTGLLLRAALLLIGAAMLGRGLPAGVWRWVTPQHLLETAFRIETGAVRAPAETAAPEIFLAEPTPAMTPSTGLLNIVMTEPNHGSSARGETAADICVMPVIRTAKPMTVVATSCLRPLFDAMMTAMLISATSGAKA